MQNKNTIGTVCEIILIISGVVFPCLYFTRAETFIQQDLKNARAQNEQMQKQATQILQAIANAAETGGDVLGVMERAGVYKRAK